MNILLLQHFESYWNAPMQNMYNTNFDECMSKVVDFVVANDNLDKIIITLFEDFELNHEYEILENICRNKGIDIDVHTYGYAWQRDDDSIEQYPNKTKNIDWCQGTRSYHEEHDILEIHDWQKEIKEQNAKVFLGGAFENECLLDISTVLEVLEIDFERVEGLIVGSGYDYDFVFENCFDIESSIAGDIMDMSDKLTELLDDFDDEESIIREDIDSLIEIENGLNKAIIPNAKMIEALGLTFDSDNEIIDEIVDNIIHDKKPFTKYSDISDQLNLEKIKLKLQDESTAKPKEIKKSKHKLN
jgi:hypothetical protein